MLSFRVGISSESSLLPVEKLTQLIARGPVSPSLPLPFPLSWCFLFLSFFHGFLFSSSLEFSSIKWIISCSVWVTQDATPPGLIFLKKKLHYSTATQVWLPKTVRLEWSRPELSGNISSRTSYLIFILPRNPKLFGLRYDPTPPVVRAVFLWHPSIGSEKPN